MECKAVHIFYSGNVQGVGFRFRTEAIANEIKVCGWVRNLCDGRVEVWAEENKANLIRFLASIDSKLGQYIVGKDVIWLPPERNCSGFRIKY